MITFEGVKRANNNERAVLTEEQARKAQILASYDRLDERGKATIVAMIGALVRMIEAH